MVVLLLLLARMALRYGVASKEMMSALGLTRIRITISMSSTLGSPTAALTCPGRATRTVTSATRASTLAPLSLATFETMKGVILFNSVTVRGYDIMSISIRPCLGSLQ